MPRPLLALAGAVLLAGGAAALAAGSGSSDHGSGPLSHQWFLIGAVVLAVGTTAALNLNQRLKESEPQSAARARLGRGVIALIAVATAGVPLALFFLRDSSQSPAGQLCTKCTLPSAIITANATPPQPTAPQHPTKPSTLHLPPGLIIAILAILVGVAVLITVILLLIKFRHGDEPTDSGALRPIAEEEAEDDSVLGAAVLAGRDALEGEARAAIIACYAAMEDSLAGAGVPRLASDSPTDLLIRVAESGTVNGPAPDRLTDLFREARFSTHPMETGHLDQARGALDEITEQLTVRRRSADVAVGAAGPGSAAR